ncbi:MAG TPA: beta-N-acetylhexosaminidase [Parvularculaceae bacterium]|nr:beta-N-acetylhexosaminidase [Parvularculaceae bacterium]
MPSAAIYDTEGPRLSADERAFFRDADPWGFILFARHCESPEAVKAHCAELREAVGRDAPILIDQEGGRVARLKPPVFPAHPAPALLGALAKLDPKKAREAARLDGYLLGRMVSSLGITIDCAPMLDVPQSDSDIQVIGDRAIATHPHQIAALGREMMEGLIEGGALPVIKHLPGHGRALVDSHHDLPRVVAPKKDLREIDFVPFKALSDAPIGMTAHILYEAYDPDRPATLSPVVIREVIRGEIGFDGLLLTDDLKMKALGGPVASRAKAAIEAGCDVALCCNYALGEKIETAKSVPLLAGRSAARAEAALARLERPPRSGDIEAGYARLSTLLRPVSA